MIIASYKMQIPCEVEANLAIGVLINVVLQHVQPLNFHQQVTSLMLSIVCHVVRYNFLHQLQQRLLLGLIILLHLLPLFSHLTSQVPVKDKGCFSFLACYLHQKANLKSDFFF